MLGNVFLLTVTAQLAVLCLQEGASSSPIHGDMIVLPQKIVANYNGYYLREVVFWCVVKQAPFYMDNPFQITWSKNGTELNYTNSTHLIIHHNTLIIIKPTVNDEGSYECTEQGYPDNTATGILEVHLDAISHKNRNRLRKVNKRDEPSEDSAPSNNQTKPIVTSRRNQTGIMGHSGYIHINITGNYSKIVWRKDGLFLIQWPHTDIYFAGYYESNVNGTIKIVRLRVNNNGTYEVAVSNEIGTTYHYPELAIRYPSMAAGQSAGNCGKVSRCIRCDHGSEFKRDVINRNRRYSSPLFDPANVPWFQAPIAIAAPPSCVKVWVGQTLELKCEFVGFPYTYAQWQQMAGANKFEKKVAESGNRITMYNGLSTPSLIIKNIQRKDQNTYTCRGRNAFGIVQFETKVKVYDYKEFCGTPTEYYKQRRRIRRIVGGTPVRPKEWPWQAWLTFNPDVWPDPNSFCGGVIIHSKWVLTAFHCISDPETMFSGILTPTEDLRIHVGVYNRSVPNERSRQDFRVKKVHLLENLYNADKDLALLELKKPIFFSKLVRPICLGKTVPLPETECEVSGWGWTALDKPVSDVLKKAVVPLVHVFECRRFYPQLSLATICAGLPIGGDGTCPGDSGGPLACKRRGKHQWDLIGLVSGGKGCGHGYTYYSNVVEYRQWIIDTTGIDF